MVWRWLLNELTDQRLPSQRKARKRTHGCHLGCLLVTGWSAAVGTVGWWVVFLKFSYKTEYCQNCNEEGKEASSHTNNQSSHVVAEKVTAVFSISQSCGRFWKGYDWAHVILTFSLQCLCIFMLENRIAHGQYQGPRESLSTDVFDSQSSTRNHYFGVAINVHTLACWTRSNRREKRLFFVCVVLRENI